MYRYACDYISHFEEKLLLVTFSRAKFVTTVNDCGLFDSLPRRGKSREGDAVRLHHCYFQIK